MEEICVLVNGLTEKDNKIGCQCLARLLEISCNTPFVYPFFDSFSAMLNNKNSYVRTRGLLLISANVQYDTEDKTEKVIASYLTHINDCKPITSRQCIKSLPPIAKHKPALRQCILDALYNADPLSYNESMQGLIINDIKNAIDAIKKL